MVYTPVPWQDALLLLLLLLHIVLHLLLVCAAEMADHHHTCLLPTCNIDNTSELSNSWRAMKGGRSVGV
jgi:hypothetical protein